MTIDEAIKICEEDAEKIGATLSQTVMQSGADNLPNG
jgi:hypothetical protein